MPDTTSQPQVAFTQAAADKIVQAVKTVLGQPANGTGSRVLPKVFDNRFFWAKFTSGNTFEEVIATDTSDEDDDETSSSPTQITWTALTGGRTGTLAYGGNFGNVFLVRQEFDCTQPLPIPLYFPVANCCTVTIGDHDTAGGVYKGQIFTTNDAQVTNLAEGTSGHWLASGQTVIGIMYGQTTEDTPRTIVKVDRLPNYPLIACTVEDDGSGINGTYSAAPTYKYNCTDLDGNSIGTSLAPVRPRLFGAVDQNSNSPAYGTGFWTGGTFNWWMLARIRKSVVVQSATMIVKEESGWW